MGLQIQVEDGRFKPAIVCDHCGQRIDDARMGNYQWQMADHGQCAEDKTIFFTHKGCCRPFEEAQGGRRRWAWAPLSSLPVFLAANLSLSLKDATRSAELMASL
jgi:hypothetical protein